MGMQQMRQQPPQTLHFEADKSVGINGDVSPQAPTQSQDPEQVGLPGHRVLELISSWGASKGGENDRMNEAEAFYDGDVWTEEQLKELQSRGQSPANDPIAHEKIDSYIGISHRMRRDPKAYPRTFKAQETADTATAALRYVDDITNGKNKYSEASKDFFVAGIGAIWQGVKFESNAPEFVKRRVPRVNFIYDPRSREWDFSDAKFIGEWNWVDLDDAVEMFESLGQPESAEKVKHLTGLAEGQSFQGMNNQFVLGNEGWWDSQRERVRMVHLYYRYKKQWHCCYIVGRIKLYDAPSIYKDDKGVTIQPFNASSCYVDRYGERYGTMKLMIPLQREVNYRRSKLAWLIGARQTIYEEGAVADINDLKREVIKPNAVIKVQPGALSGKRVQIDQFNTEIEAQFKLLDHAVQRLQSIGPNPAILGKSEQAKSGRALLAEQNAGMSNMSTVFDRHREFKLTAYRRDWFLIKQFWASQPDIPIRIFDDEENAVAAFLNQTMAIDQSTGQPIMDPKTSVKQMDVEWVLEEGTDMTVVKEELMNFMSQSGNMPLPRLKTMIHLSGVSNSKMLFKLLDEENPKPNPEMEELQKKAAYLEGMLQAAKIDAEIAKTEKTRVDALAAMSQNMLSSEMLQAFPLDYGVRSNVEDFLDQDIHPFGNAFGFEPPPQMEPMPMTDGPMQAGPDGAPMPGPQQPAEMQQRAAPQLVNRQEPQNMPGAEPVLGGEGGLPLPPPGQGGLAPPPGTRP
jgi:hypothetical protein